MLDGLHPAKDESTEKAECYWETENSAVNLCLAGHTTIVVSHQYNQEDKHYQLCVVKTKQQQEMLH